MIMLSGTLPPPCPPLIKYHVEFSQRETDRLLNLIASFGDFFETPFGAIPFFLIVGLAAAPGVTQLEAARSEGAMLSLSTFPGNGIAGA